MNDFTKEELNEILQNIKISEITVGAQRFHLIGKIQSMIDSKCSHEKDHLSDFTVVYPCKHCGELFQ